VGVRYFTPEEANDALAAVRPLAERMVEHRRALLQGQGTEEQLAARIAGNGRLAPGELARAHDEAAREAAGLTRCLEAIQELGGIVKDLDRGLVDFPARRGSGDVLLCWQLGEAEVAHWHGLDDGFSGRRPLPF
jgi:hypothetical protein